ncbi:MAG: PAS domain S-box protein [Labilithrix sp.]|nr:PAS domain S-box protein [Labilithrix sp.]
MSSDLLSRASHELSEALLDRSTLLEAIVREIARATNASCAIRLLARDGAGLEVSSHAGGAQPPRDLPRTLVVPLVVRGESTGSMTLTRRSEEPAFTSKDEALARELGERAALAIENARLVELARTGRAETALAEANVFLDSVIENLPNMVFVKDAERLSFVRMNRAGEELLGLSRDALLGKTDYDFFPAEQAAFFQGKDRQVLEGRVLVEIPEERIDTAHGPRLLATKKVPILDDDGTPRYLLGISHDITDRKAAEEMRARLAAIVDDSDDAIIGMTIDGIVTSWNRSAGRIFGYAADEMVGRASSVLLTGRHADEAHIGACVARGERVAPFETVRKRRDGEEIDVFVSVSPVHDDTGELVGLSEIARDITELKRTQREIASAKAALETANRELESFSYSVAHDLRAPLRSIDGFSQALLEDHGDKLDAGGKRHLGYVRESAQLMARLIDDILALARVARAEVQRESVDLSALARTAHTRLVRHQPDRRVAVEIRDGLVADGDPRLLALVIDNLLGNAWKFTSKRDDARIEVGSSTVDRASVFFVRDNGAGFDMKYVNKLFGVFQRLHTGHDFEGTGVGLATVQRIVHRHGGRVWAEGAVGSGATFHFTLGERSASE